MASNVPERPRSSASTAPIESSCGHGKAEQREPQRSSADTSRNVRRQSCPDDEDESNRSLSPSRPTSAASHAVPGQDLSEKGPRPPRFNRSATSFRPFSAFSKRTKWSIVAISGMAGMFSPISSNIFVPAIPTLSDAFNRSESDISLAVTIYLVLQAITPAIFGSMSDSFGRRPVYVGTLSVYLAANMGLALCPTSAY